MLLRSVKLHEVMREKVVVGAEKRMMNERKSVDLTKPLKKMNEWFQQNLVLTRRGKTFQRSNISKTRNGRIGECVRRHFWTASTLMTLEWRMCMMLCLSFNDSLAHIYISQGRSSLTDTKLHTNNTFMALLSFCSFTHRHTQLQH